MARNDGYLYSGQTSASRRAEKELARQIERAEKRRKLTPSADVILDLIEKEKATVQQKLLDYITTDKTEDELKAVLISLKLYSEYLESLKNSVQNILRHKDSKKEATDE